jgi:hypothetical protein
MKRILKSFGLPEVWQNGELAVKAVRTHGIEIEIDIRPRSEKAEGRELSGAPESRRVVAAYMEEKERVRNRRNSWICNYVIDIMSGGSTFRRGLLTPYPVYLFFG